MQKIEWDSPAELVEVGENPLPRGVRGGMKTALRNFADDGIFRIH